MRRRNTYSKHFSAANNGFQKQGQHFAAPPGNTVLHETDGVCATGRPACHTAVGANPAVPRTTTLHGRATRALHAMSASAPPLSLPGSIFLPPLSPSPSALSPLYVSCRPLHANPADSATTRKIHILLVHTPIHISAGRAAEQQNTTGQNRPGGERGWSCRGPGNPRSFCGRRWRRRRSWGRR